MVDRQVVLLMNSREKAPRKFERKKGSDTKVVGL